ncbi:MAG: aminomethyl-transferring glycine dehydrogenase subunit GcvPA [Actinobacteria bacterium]|nr:aminomethyl-transferring glycine dehydrogenase subunit GcvPA [Actinomycetota bacterium]
MRYISITASQRRKMLEQIGCDSIEDLFEDIPKSVRFLRPLDLPSAQSEMQVSARLSALAESNIPAGRLISFAGAGCYDHYIPSVVDHVIRRPEFFTAYTPYQPEVSQGTLQALYEYQSMICELTGMDVANASMYDGPTALVEAIFMATRVTARQSVLCVGDMHPEWVSTIRTYSKSGKFSLIELPEDTSTGRISAAHIENSLDPSLFVDVAAVVTQSPSFFGVIDDIAAMTTFAHGIGAVSVAAVNPVLLGILRPPSDFGVDVVVGDGQSIGSPMSFGGPGFGFFACRGRFLRQMPGRIVGRTVDVDGREAYTLTLSTREQHIRREKATSNICSNHSLNALAAAVYLSAVGGNGLAQVAKACVDNARFLYRLLLETGKFTPLWDAPFGYEFALRYSGGNVSEMQLKMIDRGYIAGVSAARIADFEGVGPASGLDLSDVVIFAVTEKRTAAEMIAFAREIETL